MRSVRLQADLGPERGTQNPEPNVNTNREARTQKGEQHVSVDVSADAFDAGAELTLRGKVSCAPAADLRGHTLLIKDEAGVEVATAALSAFDGAINETSEVVVSAPSTPGGYTWLAVCPEVVKQGVSYPETSAAIPFTVKPHSSQVVVWDVPSAIVVGEDFRVKVGIKCPHGCSLAHHDFGVFDDAGTAVGGGTLSEERWPGTSALYIAEVELEAPDEKGLHTWSVKHLPKDGRTAHAEGSASFGVRAVSHPEYIVTVEAVDQASQTPISGARVVMHPYKAVTDERGVAEIRVAKGAYRLFVSQTRYVTFGLPVEVAADMTARAELYVEPVPERN